MNASHGFLPDRAGRVAGGRSGPGGLLAILLLTLLLAACASSGRKDAYESTVYAYSAAVRWEGVLAALDFVAPERRAAEPLTSLQMGRYQQYRVTAYHLLSDVEDEQGRRVRRAQIGLANLNTLAERVVMHEEVWRWSEADKRWWLESGLPSLDPAR